MCNEFIAGITFAMSSLGTKPRAYGRTEGTTVTPDHRTSFCTGKKVWEGVSNFVFFLFFVACFLPWSCVTLCMLKSSANLKKRFINACYLFGMNCFVLWVARFFLFLSLLDCYEAPPLLSTKPHSINIFLISVFTLSWIELTSPILEYWNSRRW